MAQIYLERNNVSRRARKDETRQATTTAKEVSQEVVERMSGSLLGTNSGSQEACQQGTDRKGLRRHLVTPLSPRNALHNPLLHHIC
jgi:hypothetical protein